MIFASSKPINKMVRSKVTLVSKRGRDGPKRSHVAPKLGIIEEEERIEDPISTKDIISQLGDIVTLGLPDSELQDNAMSSGLNMGMAWTQTDRSGGRYRTFRWERRNFLDLVSNRNDYRYQNWKAVSLFGYINRRIHQRVHCFENIIIRPSQED